MGRARNTLVIAAIVAAAAGVGGCNLVDSGTNIVNGKEQFIANCGSCHMLARAGTTGVVGPSLDAAFQRARQDGFGESTFEGLVYAQIDSPNRNPSVDPGTKKPLPVMPADIVTGEDAEDVAAYVASAAGKPGEDTGALAQVGAAQAEGTAEAENGVLEIPATGGTNYQFAEATAPRGRAHDPVAERVAGRAQHRPRGRRRGRGGRRGGGGRRLGDPGRRRARRVHVLLLGRGTPGGRHGRPAHREVSSASRCRRSSASASWDAR